MHIRIPLVILLLLLSGHVSGSIHAQEATPALTGADLGLPDLEVTITDDGWSLPPEIAAGRYLLTATYDGNEEFGTVAFMRLPEGWSFEDLSAALAAANTEENVLNPDAAASPTASDGTNVEPVGVEEAFAWLYRLTFAGGLSVLAGETSQGVVDLAAGNWAVWSDNFSGEPQALTVNGDFPVDPAEPTATMTITQISIGNSYTRRFAGDFVAGRNVIKIVNASDQPHLIEFVGINMPLTPLEFFSLLHQDQTGEPLPNQPVPDGAEATTTSYYAATMSSGMTQWMIVDLEPGDYYLTCWVRELGDLDYSHAALGELDLITVP